MSDQPMTNYTPAQAADIVRGMKVVHAKIAELEAENAELERKGKELCAAYGNALITIHDLRAQVARLSGPVSDEEWLDLCAGDHVRFADVQRHEVDRFLASRTAPAKEPA